MDAQDDDLSSTLAAVDSKQRGAKVRDAMHLSFQSLGRAVDATDSILQNAIFEAHVHSANGEYSHLDEKALGHSHTAMKYLTMGSTIGDTAVKSDGTFFTNLFKDPNALPDMVMPMLQPHRHFPE